MKGKLVSRVDAQQATVMLNNDPDLSSLLRHIKQAHTAAALAGKVGVTPPPSPNEYILDPNSHTRLLWDYTVIVLIIYTALLVPMRIAFADELEATDDQARMWIALDRVVDILFILDVVLNFYTGHYYAGVLVTNRNQIAKKYARNGLALDVCAALPIDWMVSDTSNKKVLRAMTALKLFRMVRLSRYFAKLEMHTNLNSAMIQLIQLTMFWLVSVHWVGCGWLAVRVPRCLEFGISWQANRT
eukprot:332227-Prymnesium_polylepis.1